MRREEKLCAHSAKIFCAQKKNSLRKEEKANALVFEKGALCGRIRLLLVSLGETQ